VLTRSVRDRRVAKYAKARATVGPFDWLSKNLGRPWDLTRGFQCEAFGKCSTTNRDPCSYADKYEHVRTGSDRADNTAGVGHAKCTKTGGWRKKQEHQVWRAYCKAQRPPYPGTSLFVPNSRYICLYSVMIQSWLYNISTRITCIQVCKQFYDTTLSKDMLWFWSELWSYKANSQTHTPCANHLHSNSTASVCYFFYDRHWVSQTQVTYNANRQAHPRSCSHACTCRLITKHTNA